MPRGLPCSAVWFVVAALLISACSDLARLKNSGEGESEPDELASQDPADDGGAPNDLAFADETSSTTNTLETAARPESATTTSSTGTTRPRPTTPTPPPTQPSTTAARPPTAPAQAPTTAAQPTPTTQPTTTTEQPNTTAQSTTTPGSITITTIGNTTLRGVLWTADHENGDTAEWNDIAVSGTANVVATQERVHSGNYAAKLTIDTTNGKSGVRPGVVEIMPDYPRRQPGNLPDEAYFSAYYLFPEEVIPGDSWWNVFQWKDEEAGVTLHPTWMVNAWDSDQGGRMRFTLYRGVGDNNLPILPHIREAVAPVDIPVGQWVHLECFYEWSLSPEGRVACWQDGVPIWDVQNVRTDLDMGYEYWPRQWTTTNYSVDTSPAVVSIYVDDAAISLDRLGPNWR